MKEGLETDVDDVTIYCSFPGAVKLVGHGPTVPDG